MAELNMRQRAAMWAWTEAGGLRNDLRQLTLQTPSGVGVSAESPNYLIDIGRTGTPRAVQPGRCCSFDGVDDYINTGDVCDIGTGEVSVTCWVKTTTAATKAIVTKNNSLASTSGRYGIYVLSAKAYVFVTYWNGSANFEVTSTGGPNINDNVWHHIAMVYSRTDLTCYVDGVLQVTSSASSIPLAADLTNAVPLHIGAANGAATLNGNIFDVRVYNRALTSTEVGQIHATSKPGGRPDVAIYPGNLIGHWKLDDTVATKRDSSGNGYHGTQSGGVSIYTGADVPFSWQNEVGYTDTAGDLIPQKSSIPSTDVLGNTLQYTGAVPRNAKLIDSFCGTFDGVDDQASCSSSTVSSGATSFTAAAWVYHSGVATYRGVVGDWGGDGFKKWQLYLSNDNRIRANISGDGTLTRVRDSVEVVSVASWSHICVVYDAGDIKLFLNGVESATTLVQANVVTALSGASTVTRIGTSSAELLNGRLSDVRVYSSAISPADILALYQGKDITPQPVGHWPLAEGDGTTLYDVSGNGNHATLSGITPASFWGTRQSVSHRNIRKGFRLSSTVRIPAKNDGLLAADGNEITSAAGVFHNNAETRIDFTGGVSSAPWCDAARLGYSVPQAYNFGDALPGSGKMTKKSVTVPAPRESDFQIQ